ncbi:MAG: FtsW/RodA/SpoVE family cell cycle protein [Candidatus Omnitrophica bacterium]|nr:FtsW/RodA/SpoVE family cell cycle protein [Candidatus Omnitrophota bacterium]
MLGLQVFINVAMNLGLAPVVGIPLPLMSYGGSSVFTTFISLGILANIDRKRSVF